MSFSWLWLTLAGGYSFTSAAHKSSDLYGLLASVCASLETSTDMDQIGMVVCSKDFITHRFRDYVSDKHRALPVSSVICD